MELRLETLIKYILNKFAQKKCRLIKTALVKYVYLADYFYARSEGKLYTQANWKLIHFGPFATEVSTAIEKLKKSNVLQIQEFPTESGTGESYFYASKDQNEFKEFFSEYPDLAKTTFGRLMNELGPNTDKILTYVYSQTEPMLHAKPDQNLDFSNLSPLDSMKPVAAEPLKGKKKKRALELVKRIASRNNTETSKLELESKIDAPYIQAKISDNTESFDINWYQ